jgi:hypothetical protein
MTQEGPRLVCGKCGGWFQGFTGRRMVAAGIIANRSNGRSLRVSVTAAGVTGRLAKGVAA